MPSDPVTTSLRSDAYNFPLSDYDRPRLALENFLKADLDGSVKAIFSPESLSPHQRKRLKNRFSRDPVMAAIMDVATNPLVIIGTIASLAYPPLASGEVFEFAARAGGIASRLNPIARFLGTPLTIFRGNAKLVDALMEQSALTSEFKERFGVRGLNDLFSRFRNLVGRNPTTQEMSLAALKRMAADRSDTFLNKSIGHLAEKNSGVNLGGESLLKKSLTISPKSLRGINGMANDMGRLNETMYADIPNKFLDDIATHLEGNGLATRHFYTRDPFNDKVIHGTQKKIIGPRLKNYYPQQIINSRTLMEENPLDKLTFEESAMKLKYIHSRALLRRQGFSMPSLEHLEEIKQHLNPRAFQVLKDSNLHYRQELEQKILPLIGQSKPKEAIKEILMNDYNLREEVANGLGDKVQQLTSAGKMEEALRFIQSKFDAIGQIPQYSLRMDKVMSLHINSLAHQHAWAIPKTEGTKSVGAIIEEEAGILKRTDPQRWRILTNDYIPMLRGMKTWREQERQIIFNDFKLKLSSSIQTPRMTKVLNATAPGKAVRTWLIDTLNAPSGSLSAQSFTGSLTSLFYHGALGFNPAPAFKNILQPLITTASVIGMPDTIRGSGILLPKLGQLIKRTQFHMGKGLSLAEADQKALWEIFPEAMQENILGSPMFGEVTDESIPMVAQGFQKALATGKSASMAMFHTTERFNRLLTYEASAAKANLEGLGAKETQRFASTMVRMTQFSGGPLGIPHGMLNIPAPIRQFAQFPLRMLDFMYSSLRFGSAAAVAEGKMPLDLGTIGRTVRNSAIAGTIAQRALGFNIDNSLLFGALPSPLSKDAPFFPFPIVSPAVGIAGSLGGAVFTGDFSRVPSSLAVGVPGGVAFRRAYKSLAPSRADYQHRDVDGKITVTDKVGKLVGNFTPAQLFLRSVGIRTNNVEAEQQFTQFVLKQRDILRQFRTEYLAALQSNSMETAQDIQAAYQKKYPELPPLRVKKSDIRALRLRTQTTRIQRILKSLPADVRPVFEEIASMSVAAEATRLVQNNSDALPLLMPPKSSNPATATQPVPLR